ncbi:MAG: DnaB-like helicase C-terminal domain-containing protein, partial [Rhodospirillales bacterium]
EQDADVVMFIYREEYYLERKKPGHRVDDKEGEFERRMTNWEDAKAKVANLADIIVAKQRHGPIGDRQLLFQGAFTRFADLDRHHSLEETFDA